MTSNYSEARKKDWLKLSPEDRSKRMSLLAKLKWSKVGIKERRAHSMNMLSAKKLKNA